MESVELESRCGTLLSLCGGCGVRCTCCSCFSLSFHLLSLLLLLVSLFWSFDGQSLQGSYTLYVVYFLVCPSVSPRCDRSTAAALVFRRIVVLFVSSLPCAPARPHLHPSTNKQLNRCLTMQAPAQRLPNGYVADGAMHLTWEGAGAASRARFDQRTVFIARGASQSDRQEEEAVAALEGPQRTLPWMAHVWSIGAAKKGRRLPQGNR